MQIPRGPRLNEGEGIGKTARWCRTLRPASRVEVLMNAPHNEEAPSLSVRDEGIQGELVKSPLSVGKGGGATLLNSGWPRLDFGAKREAPP